MYQKRLAAFLAKVCQRFTVPTLGATDLSCLAEDFGHLCFVANSSYWATEIRLEACVRDRKTLFVGCQNVESFSKRVSDFVKYY